MKPVMFMGHELSWAEGKFGKAFTKRGATNLVARHVSKARNERWTCTEAPRLDGTMCFWVGRQIGRRTS